MATLNSQKFKNIFTSKLKSLDDNKKDKFLKELHAINIKPLSIVSNTRISLYVSESKLIKLINILGEEVNSCILKREHPKPKYNLEPLNLTSQNGIPFCIANVSYSKSFFKLEGSMVYVTQALHRLSNNNNKFYAKVIVFNGIDSYVYFYHGVKNHYIKKNKNKYEISFFRDDKKTCPKKIELKRLPLKFKPFMDLSSS